MKDNNVAYRREFLEKLSTAELDEMLQKELKKESIDDDLVRVVLSVLEEREADYPVESNEEIESAVERYASCLDGLETESAKPARKRNAALKVASILVIVGLLFFVLPQATNAESFFEMLARWTDSIFEFFDPREDNVQPEYAFETDHPGLQQIYDAIVETGVADPVVPMWIPTGYELQHFQVINNASDTLISSEFARDSNYIFFNMLLHNQEASFKYEKDTQNVDVIELGGVKHYVLSNFETKTVSWVVNNVECSIVTNCHKEEIYGILKSIYIAEE